MAKSSVYPSSFIATLWTLGLIGASVYAGWWIEQNSSWLLTSVELPAFLAIPLQYQTEAPIIRTLFGVLGGFLTFFALAYLLKALVDSLRLGVINIALGWRARRGGFTDPAKPPSARSWWYYPLFNRLWQDYAATLHPQSEGEGEEARARYRATTPAELYFNTEMLVDAPMRVEFFRHLPGILTGTGIVSTFAGILLGLTEFNPTVEPDQVTTQLKHLFTGVSTAFVASFFAIFAAILVTVIEKLIIGWRYGQVTELHGRLDDLFRGGVESEYLAQLVRSGQQSGQQLGEVAQYLPRLGEGLMAPVATGEGGMTVADLQGVMRTLSEATRQGQQQLAKELEVSLQASLVEPLREIATALNRLLELQDAGGNRLVSQLAQEGTRHQGLLSDIQGNVGAVRESLSRVESGIGQVRDEVARQGDRDAQSLDQVAELLGRVDVGVSGVRDELTGVRDGVTGVRDGVTGVRDEVSGVRDEVIQQGERETAALGQLAEALGRMGEQDAAAFNRLADAVGRLGEQDSVALAQLTHLISQQGESDASTLTRLTEAVTRIQEQGSVGFDELAQAVRRLAQEDSAGMERMVAAAESQGRRQEEALGRLAEGLTQTMQELSRTSQEAARDRDAFLLSRMAESQGELAERVNTSFQEGLREPVERIVGSVEAVREEQTRLRDAQSAMGRELNEALLNAFSAHLREMVTRLVEKLAELGERLSRERQAMEANISNLLEGMAEAARQGGDRLADQIQNAMSGTESRQDKMLEALSLYTADLRGDLNLIQERVQSTTRDATAELARQTSELVRQAGLETSARVQESSAEAVRALGASIEEVAKQGEERERTLMERLESDNKAMADQMRAALQEELDATARLLAQSIQATGDSHSRQAQALADMMLATLANKLEDRFGGLTEGLSDLQSRLGDAQQETQQKMQAMVEGLRRESSTRADSERLIQLINDAIEKSNQSFATMKGALQEVDQGLKGDLGRVQENLLLKSAETVETLSSHVSDVVTNTTNEQTVFINVLGERLETLRRQIKVK